MESGEKTGVRAGVSVHATFINCSIQGAESAVLGLWPISRGQRSVNVEALGNLREESEALGEVRLQFNRATAEKADVGQAGTILDCGGFLLHAIFAISCRRDAVCKHEGNHRQGQH